MLSSPTVKARAAGTVMEHEMKRAPETLFVANMPYSFTDDQLAELFEPYGLVITSRMARDKVTGQSKGFGFVELAPDKARAKAIAGVNGMVLDGRTIEVRIADVTEKPAKPARRFPRAVAPSQPYVSQPYVGTLTATATPPAAAKRAVLVEYRNLSARRLRGAG
jgi:RNA recognition motif-containing protein